MFGRNKNRSVATCMGCGSTTGPIANSYCKACGWENPDDPDNPFHDTWTTERYDAWQADSAAFWAKEAEWDDSWQ